MKQYLTERERFRSQSNNDQTQKFINNYLFLNKNKSKKFKKNIFFVLIE